MSVVELHAENIVLHTRNDTLEQHILTLEAALAASGCAVPKLSRTRDSDDHGAHRPAPFDGRPPPASSIEMVDVESLSLGDNPTADPEPDIITVLEEEDDSAARIPQRTSLPACLVAGGIGGTFFGMFLWMAYYLTLRGVKPLVIERHGFSTPAGGF